MKAGILTNGGDTPSLNAILYYVRDALVHEGYTKVLGFRDGYLGLMTGTFDDITIAGIPLYTGGTFLSSLRYSPVPKHKPSKKDKPEWDAKLGGCLNNMKDLDLLVVIGGDGTLAATSKFIDYTHDTKCHIIGIPRTIDNDIRSYTYHHFEGRNIETSVCPGFPSAAEKLIQCTFSLRTTAKSSNRAFALETMGRNAGWLALTTVIGFADRCIIPECDMTEEKWNGFVDLCAHDYNESGHLVVGVSEGSTFDGHEVKQIAYGERKLGGAGDLIAKGGHIRDKNGKKLRYVDGLESSFEKRGLSRTVSPTGYDGIKLKVPVEVRCNHGDYHPRMGQPSNYDVKLAEVFGKRVRQMVKDGMWGHMPVLDEVVRIDDLDVRFTKAIPISRVEHKPLPMDYYDRDKLTASEAYFDLVHKLVDMEAVIRA